MSLLIGDQLPSSWTPNPLPLRWLQTPLALLVFALNSYLQQSLGLLFWHPIFSPINYSRDILVKRRFFYTWYSHTLATGTPQNSASATQWKKEAVSLHGTTRTKKKSCLKKKDDEPLIHPLVEAHLRNLYYLGNTKILNKHWRLCCKLLFKVRLFKKWTPRLKLPSSLVL